MLQTTVLSIQKESYTQFVMKENICHTCFDFTLHLD